MTTVIWRSMNRFQQSNLLKKTRVRFLIFDVSGSDESANLVLQEKQYKVSLITNLIDKITELVKLKLDQVKVEVKGQVAVLVARLVVILVIALLLSFALLFFGLGLAFFMNNVFSSDYWGFVFVGGLALLVAIFLILKARSESFTDMIKSKLLDNED